MPASGTVRTVVFAGVLVGGCSSSAVVAQPGPPPPDAGTEVDAGTPPPAPPPPPPAPVTPKNPYGAPYPTQHLGYRPRSADDLTAGDVVPNTIWGTGYLPNASAPSVIQLADVYDPEGRTHDLVLVSSLWHGVSPSDLVVQQLTAKSPRRVAVLYLVHNAVGVSAPELSHLTELHGRHASAWGALDPGAGALSRKFPLQGYPHLVTLDARTMEILTEASGAPPDLVSDLEALRLRVVARPPAY